MQSCIRWILWEHSKNARHLGGNFIHLSCLHLSPALVHFTNWLPLQNTLIPLSLMACTRSSQLCSFSWLLYLLPTWVPLLFSHLFLDMNSKKANSLSLWHKTSNSLPFPPQGLWSSFLSLSGCFSSWYLYIIALGFNLFLLPFPKYMLCFACNFPLWLDNSKIVSFLCPVTSPLSLSLKSKNASFREIFSDSSREIWSPVTHLEITRCTLPVTISLHSGSPVDSEMKRQEQHPCQLWEGIQSILTDLMSKHSQFRSPFSISWHLSSSLQLCYPVLHLSLFIPKCFLGSEEWSLAFAGSPCQTLFPSRIVFPAPHFSLPS